MNTITLCPWRPLFWEPVAGTGERIMVGVLHGYDGDFRATRTIRDDVLTGLFGKSSSGLKLLIDHGLNIFQLTAKATGSLETLEQQLTGLYPGPLRLTEAANIPELLHTACLLYSSLGNLDRLDESDESDAPQQDEVNKRFGSEVKEIVSRKKPELITYFGKSASLIQNGQKVKFGYLSPKAALHFTVLHPVRQSASMKDARARIFELQRARDMAGFEVAALITAVSRDDDATLGSRQREQLRENKLEIEQEADSVNLRWYAVESPLAGAEKLIEIAA